MKKKNEDELVKIVVKIPKSKKEMIQKIVEKTSYNTTSDLVRTGIDKELNIQIYKDNSEARKKANYFVNKDTSGITEKDLFDFYYIGDLYRNE